MSMKQIGTPVISKQEEESANKNSNIECIVEEDSALLQVKQEYDDQDENQNNNSSNSSTINANNQGNNVGVGRNRSSGQNLDGGSFNTKRSVPVVKMYYGKKYVVGMCSQQEQDIESEEEEKPIHYYPPKLILLNFPRPHNYDAQTQLLLIENSQFQAKFQEMNQNQDITTYLEQLVVGNSLNYTEKLEVRRFWFSRFFEYAQRYPPCCRRVKKFWEWVFMLNPESNFRWRFKSFSLQWIELMTSYVEFRELFSNWLESFEQDILSELQDEKKKLFKAQLYSRYFKELLQMKNKSSFAPDDLESREDMQNQIMDEGVVIKPEGYKESCICMRAERDMRIGITPKLNKIQFKYNMKIFHKNVEVNSLFNMKEAELPVNPPTEENYDDEDEDDDDIDEDDDEEIDDDDDEDDLSIMDKEDDSNLSSQSEGSGDSNIMVSQESLAIQNQIQKLQNSIKLSMENNINSNSSDKQNQIQQKEEESQLNKEEKQETEDKINEDKVEDKTDQNINTENQSAQNIQNINNTSNINAQAAENSSLNSEELDVIATDENMDNNQRNNILD
ncbi:hypothetical protein ABPG72_008034 [Tetrahymena utriculariae]